MQIRAIHEIRLPPGGERDRVPAGGLHTCSEARGRHWIGLKMAAEVADEDAPAPAPKAPRRRTK